MIQKQLQALIVDFEEKLAQANTSAEVEDVRVLFLGRKGSLQGLMPLLKSVTPEERPHIGEALNSAKDLIVEKCTEKNRNLLGLEEDRIFQQQAVDVTAPGRLPYRGRVHPIKQMLDKIIAILQGMGFSVRNGPSIDSDFYNFEGLNYPPDHPARDMQDTFYITKDFLLRSQTSNVQLRAMQLHEPPIRVIAPGTVFRNENISARSHVFFHQIEGLYINKNVSFADLIGTMKDFWKQLFYFKQVEIRFRPSYFPFVEPGIEIDISCTMCAQKGCSLCKFSGWLEVAGAGMVHPHVLSHGGIDPETYSGFAWGLGIERLTMLHYGVEDIRMFYENDLTFLEQF